AALAVSGLNPITAHSASEEKGWYQLIVEEHRRNMTASLIANKMRIAQIEAIQYVPRFRQILRSPEAQRVPKAQRIDFVIARLKSENTLYEVPQSTAEQVELARLDDAALYEVS